MNRWSTDFYGSKIKTILCAIIMAVDIDPHTYVWTHRICSTEKYLKVNSGLWVIMIFQCKLNLSQRIYIWGFPGGSAGKESTCSVGNLGLIPGLGRSPGEGNGNPLQYSCLENPKDRGSLVGYSPRGHKESDTTERLHFLFRTEFCCLLILLSYPWGINSFCTFFWKVSS